MQAQLFLIRGVVAIAWAAAFATVSDSLTSGTQVLLVLYPLIDVIASAVDARGQRGRARRLLLLSVAISAAAAVAMVIAVTGDVGDALAVFGVWAAVAGAAQVAVALRRRRAFGWQVPMLLAGGLSMVGGFVYVGLAAGEAPTLDWLIWYAAFGGAYFVVQAGLLVRRGKRDHVDPGSELAMAIDRDAAI